MGLNGLKPNGELQLVNSKRAREVRYEAIKNALEPYGLTLTRLINNETSKKTSQYGFTNAMSTLMIFSDSEFSRYFGEGRVGRR